MTTESNIPKNKVNEGDIPVDRTCNIIGESVLQLPDVRNAQLAERVSIFAVGKSCELEIATVIDHLDGVKTLRTKSSKRLNMF